MGGAAPKLTGRRRDAARARLAKARAERLAGLLAAWTREALEAGAIVTPLNREALYRHALRRALVLQGWRWPPADDAALSVVRIAIEEILRTERPSWVEGQPLVVTEGGTLIERTRCAECGARLSEGRRKFCSEPCGSRWRRRAIALQEADAEAVADLAARVEL